MAAGDRQAFDRQMMGIALAMARRGLGRTAPNPAVGAVIVEPATREIIARGWTQPGGRPHAETEAITRAGARARGASIYVTLEPCSHFGKTPPCADAIISAGIARAVTAIADPDPRVAGRGLDKLRAAGIAVTHGVLAEEAHRVTRGHIVRVTERRPLVQVKMALGPDGDVPRGHAGQPVWVTGPEARAHGHLLRAEADAILTGRGTVVDDDPELTCRLPGMAARSPLRVVLAGRADVPLQSKLVRSASQTPVLLFCSAEADVAKTDALEGAGVRVIRVPAVAGQLWLPAVLEALAGIGMTRLLVEGGPQVWRAFARAGLVDEAVIFHARHGVGEIATSASQAVAHFLPGVRLTLTEHRRLPGDDVFRYVAKRL